MNKDLNVSDLALERPRNYDFWKMINKSNTLLILLKKVGTKEEFLRITFSGIITCRYSIEGARLKTINSIIAEKNVFNSQDDSEYLRWLEDESGGWLNDGNLKHVSIFCSDCIIDILTNAQPFIEWTKEQ